MVLEKRLKKLVLEKNLHMEKSVRIQAGKFEDNNSLGSTIFHLFEFAKFYP